MRAAYTSKERAAQIAEKEAHKYDELVRYQQLLLFFIAVFNEQIVIQIKSDNFVQFVDAELERQLKEQREKAAIADKQREQEKMQEAIRYQQELERQLEVSHF